MKKVKKKKHKLADDPNRKHTFNPSVKNKGELYTRVLKKKAKDNLLLAWKIQEAEKSS